MQKYVFSIYFLLAFIIVKTMQKIRKAKDNQKAICNIYKYLLNRILNLYTEAYDAPRNQTFYNT